jgi:hypothetical protein
MRRVRGRKVNLRRVLIGNIDEPGGGLSATWYGIGALMLAIVSIGGLIKGHLSALVFVPFAVLAAFIAVRRYRAGDI